MKSLYKQFFLTLGMTVIPLMFMSSCHDDLDLSKGPSETPSAPAEMTDGYSISFKLTLDPMGGGEEISLSRALSSNGDLRDIENYVDMEKLRILFFTCLDKSDSRSYTTSYNESKPYETGKHDIFLFESRSRWVSSLGESDYTAAQWMVTAPVFKYGNNEVYDWAYIREALTTRPFKIVILANRPDDVNFGNFDSMFDREISFDTDRGPAWGADESAAGKQLYLFAQTNNFENLDSKGWDVEMESAQYKGKKAATINGLHHCQWDPIYTSKNHGFGVYDFIMEDPRPNEPYNKNQGIFLTPQSGVGTYNMMGALSYWTHKGTDGNNHYFHPNRTRQGIPMYGVQKFDSIQNWREGTPINISDYQTGVSGNNNTKNVALLRSLVRLDLVIPTTVAKNVTDVKLRYSNVMSRCEPLDVATPTDILWENFHERNGEGICEWYDIDNYGPVIDQDYGSVASTTDPKTQQYLKEKFLQRMAWFYGAWKDWWVFSKWEKNWNNEWLNSDLPHPRIFNPVIQRNSDAYLDEVEINDPGYHHYVVYCGERNINDPSKFDNLDLEKSEICYFYFKADGTEYCVALTDYEKNPVINSIKKSDGKLKYKTSISNLNDLRKDMVNTTPKVAANYNWPLLRNHVYTFTVTKIGTNADNGGFDVLTVSSEERSSPTIKYE